MRGRVVVGFVFASMLAGAVTPSAIAQNPRVKIINGPAFTELASYQADEPTPMAESLSPTPRQQVAVDWADPSGMAPKAPFDDADCEWGDTSSNCSADGCACGPDDCAGCDGEGCRICCRPFGWSVGIEATYLKPRVENSNPGLDPPDDFQYESAPRVWAEYVTMGGWGLRGRYWDYDAEQGRQGAVNEPEVVAAQNFNDQIDAYAIDLELTKRFFIRRSEFCVSFGARNGRLKRSLSQQLSVFDLAGGGSDDASFILQDAERDLNGTGFTTAVGIRIPLGDSRFAAVANFRNSVLWGGNVFDYKLTVGEVLPAGVGDLDLNDFDYLQVVGSNNTGMWIGELQVGAEWTCPLAGTLDGGLAFAQLMFEGQWWNMPGVSTSQLGLSTNTQMYDFIGVTAAAGIRR